MPHPWTARHLSVGELPPAAVDVESIALTFGVAESLAPEHPAVTSATMRTVEVVSRKRDITGEE